MFVDLGISEPPLNSSACVVRVSGRDLLVVHSEEGLFACSATCTHEKASLAGGAVLGDTIECPLHGAVFNLRTGSVEFGPTEQALPVYPVRKHDGRLQVDLGAEQ